MSEQFVGKKKTAKKKNRLKKDVFILADIFLKKRKKEKEKIEYLIRHNSNGRIQNHGGKCACFKNNMSHGLSSVHVTHVAQSFSKSENICLSKCNFTLETFK